MGSTREMTPLLPWRPRHLVAHGEFPRLGYPHANHAVDPWRELLTAVAVGDADVDDLAPFAVGHPKRRVLHVPRLLTEDRPQQLLFRSQFRLALRRDLADEDVSRANLCADADNTLFVEVAKRFLADVGDVAGDVLIAQLGLSRLALILLDVDGREFVVLE